jgi:hypothetical protein
MPRFLALFAIPLAALSAAAAPLSPRLVCDGTPWDFGTRRNTEEVVHDFILRNEGELSAEIKSVRSSCGCTVASMSDAGRIIRPGGTGTVHVVFNLAGRTGPQNKVVTVESNDPHRRSLALQLTGTAVQALTASPPAVLFSSLPPDSPAQERMVVLSAEEPFRVFSAESDNPAFALARAEDDPDGDADAHRWRIVLDPREIVPDGAGRFRSAANFATSLGPLRVAIAGSFVQPEGAR